MKESRPIEEEDFTEVLASARAELHRYCARLVGSIFEGEDIVQDVMVRALAAAGNRDPATPIRPWLFRIAHNRAMDVIRTRETRARLSAEEALDEVDEGTPHDEVARRQSVSLAIERFIELPPMQRSVLILKDVLEATNQEIASTLGLTLASVKANLHRARARVAALAEHEPTEFPPPPARPETMRYVELFNARDWNGLQQLLAEDVKLVQTTKASVAGRATVAKLFFGGYADTPGWRLSIAAVEGREVIWVETGPESQPYFMTIRWKNGQVTEIRDFRYARYIARDASPAPCGAPSSS